MIWMWFACSAPPPPQRVPLERTSFVRPSNRTPWVHSSTDPRSTRPGAPHWFANDDRGHVQRRENSRFVLVDERGPGALTRLWSANPERGGTLTIEADGRTVLNGLMTDLLEHGVGGGHTLHTPVDYRERLVVSMSQNRGKGVYWIAEGHRSLAPELHPTGPAIEAFLHTSTPLPQEVAGGPLPLHHHLDGPGMITSLSIRTLTPRSTSLRLILDGEEVAAVPITGLMGSGPAPSYADLWREVSSNGAIWTGVLRTPIAFRSSLDILLQGAPSDATLGLAVEPLPPGRHLRFRASHHTAPIRTRPRQDFRLAHWMGPGLVVAETLVVNNPVEGWWGGGDAKIVADGALLRGTGTEDHFGLAWCSTAMEWGPWGGQPYNERSAITEKTCDHSGGVAVLSRGRMFDTLAFQQELRFELGVRHRDDVTIDYAATVIGYAGQL